MSATPARVRKRDGREVPFDARKIAEAIEKAFAATGRSGSALASELASVVTLSIERRSGPRASNDTPTIEGIQDLVERVLMETGHADVAKAYILYREKRARVRQALAVHHDAPVRSAEAAAGPRAASTRRSESWSKGKIVAALMMEAEVPRSTAEEIAAHVERRVFQSGFTRVTTGLLRELVDNELFARGLESHLRRQTVVGLPKFDLREGLRTGFFRDVFASGKGDLVSPQAVPETTIARAVLGAFAIDEVLPERLADRHLSGDLHFEGLQSPHRDLAGALSLGALATGAFSALGALPPSGTLEDSVDHVRHLVARARRVVAGTLVLHEIEPWLARCPRLGRRAAGGASEAARRLVRALAFGLPEAQREPAGAEIALAVRAGSALALSLASECAALPERVPAPMVVLLAEPGGVAEAAPAHAAGSTPGSGARVPRLAFSSMGVEEALAPGVHRALGDAPAPFTSTGAAAVLNLPRLALRVGAWAEAAMLESLVGLVDDAVEGLDRSRRMLESTALARGAELPEPRRRFVLSVCGLRECVRVLAQGALEATLARTILQAILERARASAAARSLPLSFAPWIRTGARSRFERLDAETWPSARSFGDGDRVLYSEGATLSPVPGRAFGEAEAEALGGVPAGVLPEHEAPAHTASLADAMRRERGAARDGGASRGSGRSAADAGESRGVVSPEGPARGTETP